MTSIRYVLAGLSCLSVLSCANSDNYAPVADVSGYEAVPSSGAYHVVAGDTLYSIAWRYGSDYRVLAKNNGISAPYDIHAGQTIYLRGGAHPQPPREVVVATVPAARPVVTTQLKSSNPTVTTSRPLPILPDTDNREPNYPVTAWVWPAQGKLLALYTNKNKGIDISGNFGDPVFAALPGKVVYAGDGLRGYGNLIILKHNSQYLSAYAYNSSLVVHEGEWVKKGQKIAAMGRVGNGNPMLHFEIRKAGLPVNPMNLLNK
jgi:lipoprotein NlpD